MEGNLSEQLRMFIPAKEIKANYTPGDMSRTDATPQDVWDRKSVDLDTDPEYREMAKDIAKRGVESPVGIAHGVHPREGKPRYDKGDPPLSFGGSYVLNGHHRIAAAARNDQLVPVTHWSVQNSDEHMGGMLAVEMKDMDHRNASGHRWGVES
jgi:hypothetical protein